MKICIPVENIETARLVAPLVIDGVELRFPLGGEKQIVPQLADLNLPILSLNSAAPGDLLSNWIQLAGELKCPIVRFACDQLFDRSSKVVARFVDWIITCADEAAELNVLLLLENRPVAGSAVAMWHLLDRIDHPAVGCCWNTRSAYIAGDSPAVAIPTLNSRIKAVLLNDAKKDESSNARIDCDLGTGAVPIRKTMDRLRGIGFDQTVFAGGGLVHQSLELLKSWGIQSQRPAPAGAPV